MDSFKDLNWFAITYEYEYMDAKQSHLDLVYKASHSFKSLIKYIIHMDKKLNTNILNTPEHFNHIRDTFEQYNLSSPSFNKHDIAKLFNGNYEMFKFIRNLSKKHIPLTTHEVEEVFHDTMPDHINNLTYGFNVFIFIRFINTLMRTYPISFSRFIVENNITQKINECFDNPMIAIILSMDDIERFNRECLVYRTTTTLTYANNMTQKAIRLYDTIDNTKCDTLYKLFETIERLCYICDVASVEIRPR
jgi:hypothetical protein